MKKLCEKRKRISTDYDKILTNIYGFFVLAGLLCGFVVGIIYAVINFGFNIGFIILYSLAFAICIPSYVMIIMGIIIFILGLGFTVLITIDEINDKKQKRQKKF